jgi:hypothetical protein
MKIKFVLFVVLASFLTLFSSYNEGPDLMGPEECTGATGTTQGCSGSWTHGSGSTHGITCHSNITSSNNVVVELDSAGTAVKSYYPGHSYTVKLSGTNNTGQNLPKFGFQLTAVLLAGSGDSLNVRQAGTWDSSAISGNVKYYSTGPITCGTCSAFNIPVIEHTTQIPATTGSGANGSTYVESFTWSAPASGTGTVVLYGIINAVNNDQTVTGDYSQNATDTIREAIVSGINEVTDNVSSFSVYPTLADDNVTLSFDLKEASAVSVTMFSMQGQEVKALLSQESLGAGSFKRTFDVSGLATGIYLVRLQIGNQSLIAKVIKE